jgi:putative transposase
MRAGVPHEGDVEIFHNRRRRHSSLGMRTPIEYELLNTTAAAA